MRPSGFYRLHPFGESLKQRLHFKPCNMHAQTQMRAAFDT